MRLSNRQKLKEWLAAGLFILPNLIVFLVFVLGPIAFSLYISLTDWPILSTPQFVGLENYRALSRDSYLWQYLRNTLILMLALPVQWAGSLALALALNRALRGRVIFRTIAFLPNVCAGVAIALLWRVLLNYDSGVVNGILRGLHLYTPNWLGDVNWSKPAMMLIGTWAAVGGVQMILYLAALQGVDQQYHEAAALDGANGWQSFWHVTWPLISPTTWFIVVTGTIGGFQAGFETAYVLTRGGPAGSTTTLVYYIYNTGFGFLKMGYASAVAWVLFAMVFAVTIVNWKFGERAVFYG